jgi:hypothetical protein
MKMNEPAVGQDNFDLVAQGVLALEVLDQYHLDLLELARANDSAQKYADKNARCHSAYRVAFASRGNEIRQVSHKFPYAERIQKLGDPSAPFIQEITRPSWLQKIRGNAQLDALKITDIIRAEEALNDALQDLRRDLNAPGVKHALPSLDKATELILISRLPALISNKWQNMANQLPDKPKLDESAIAPQGIILQLGTLTLKFKDQIDEAAKKLPPDYAMNQSYFTRICETAQKLGMPELAKQLRRWHNIYADSNAQDTGPGTLSPHQLRNITLELTR